MWYIRSKSELFRKEVVLGSTDARKYQLWEQGGRFSTWIGKVREDLRREGINEADALDRDTWRGHIYSLTNPHP